MEKIIRVLMMMVVLVVLSMPIMVSHAFAQNIDSGFQGMMYERKPDGGIGPKIPGVKITFVRENGSATKTVTTNKDGFYRISLKKGRYIVSATHSDYEEYTSSPGFIVVTGSGYQTGNIFMKKILMTTVLLIRHAEKSNDSLSSAGMLRADELVHVAKKAGVEAIFATNTNRSQETVQPLATELGLILNIYQQYDEIQELSNKVLTKYAGKVVLVAGHSDTLHTIIEAFGGDPNKCCINGDEFDNLCVITIYGPGKYMDGSRDFDPMCAELL